ncbi:hypothetical protein [Cryptosporangium sp. NPDC048952]|uniref:hypothetical protein n=1 Tax=Cryptosporangium sp. NPDC048952 TaxID=3363961 RepID=UPI003713307E
MSRRPSEEFLAALVVTAVEHGGYGWFTVTDFQCPQDDPEGTYAVIDAPDSDLRRTRIDPRVMDKGLAIIRRATGRLPDVPTPPDHPIYHHRDTGEPLYISHGQRHKILLAARRDDAGQLDIVDALAVLEIALFGAVLCT